MKIVNLTPHAIKLAPSVDAPASEWTVVQPSGDVARVSTTPGAEHAVEGIPVPCYSAPSYGPVEGLPAPQKGTLFIVSGFVAQRLEGQGRADVYSPGTGPRDNAIRCDKGRIAAVTRLNQVPL